MSTIVLFAVAWAGAADLTFTPAAPGYFSFDTGALRGTIRADGRSQGGYGTLVEKYLI